MNQYLISDAVGNLDSELLEAHFKKKEALLQKRATQCKPNRFRWSLAAAACLALLLLAAAIVIPMLNGDHEHFVGSLPRPYRGSLTACTELAIDWPWEYRTVSEKYPSVSIDGIPFRGRGREIDVSDLDAEIGSCQATASVPGVGEDVSFPVYSIRNVSPDLVVAVRMEGKYYVFLSDRSTALPTWGDMMEAYGLPEETEISQFRKSEDHATAFALTDEARLWELLRECASAPRVEDPHRYNTQIPKSYISLTVSSERLGIYKKAIRITDDGYLWTNLFEYGNCYHIGEEAAGEILSYAKKHSKQIKPESYYNAVCGTVVAVTEDAVLIDDSVRCEDPADGIVFRVLLRDLRITRYVELGYLREGDTVLIEFKGDVDTKEGYVIAGAFAVSKVILSDEHILIPE